jgi:hypothetical protein
MDERPDTYKAYEGDRGAGTKDTILLIALLQLR